MTNEAQGGEGDSTNEAHDQEGEDAQDEGLTATERAELAQFS